MTDRHRRPSLGATALAPLVWGTTYAVTTQLLPAGHPLSAALLRSLPGGLIAMLWARQLPRGAWWGRSLILGALNIGLFFPLLFFAAGRLPGGVAATLGASQPLLVAGLAAVALRERTSARQLLCAVTGAIGVAVVVLTPAAELDVMGIVAGLAGTTSMGLGVVLSKKWGRPQNVSALGYAGWLLTSGGALLLVPSLIWEGFPPQVGLLGAMGYLWLALPGGLVAYTLWFRGIRVLPAAPTSLLGLLSPLMATSLGVIIMHERPTARQIAGFVLAIGSMALAQRPSARNSPTRCSRLTPGLRPPRRLDKGEQP